MMHQVGMMYLKKRKKRTKRTRMSSNDNNMWLKTMSYSTRLKKR
jgi:hypothetical protein